MNIIKDFIDINVYRLLRITLFIFMFFYMQAKLCAQKDFDLSGYVSELPSMTRSNDESEEGFNNTIHNRLEFVYYNSPRWTTEIAVRNRLISGQLVSNYANFQYIIENDEGFLDLNFNWGSGNNYILNTAFDRLSLQYVKDNFQLKFGRQRISWGQSLIWNPNDVFNTYSYFDFDYPERSGVDALRLKYNTSSTSMLDAAVKIDRYNQVTAAIRYKFKVNSYDVQFLTGELNQEEVIAGAGWNGHIAKVGFYGEATYLKSFSDTNYNGIISSIGGNYSCTNGVTFATEWLYMSKANSIDGIFSTFYYSPSSIKYLSIGNYSYLLFAKYIVNTRLSIGLSFVGFDFPFFHSYYLGPKAEYSVSDKLSVSAYMQYFSIDNFGHGMDNSSFFLRMKYEF